MLFTVKLIALLFSLLGYILYIHKKGIALGFSPILAIACISLLMFLAGLLNVMRLAVIGLFAFGFLLLFRSIRSLKFRPQKEDLLVILFFLASYFFFAYRLKNSQVSWYDNFSHWALVVRDMLKTNQLPGPLSYLVTFQGYPTGGSGFLYYICKILEKTEGSMLFGQFLILLGCLCTFFPFISRTSCPRFSAGVFGLVAVYLLCVCVPVTELLVDTLIALLAMASFAITVYYKDTPPPKNWLCNAVLLSFLVLVKTSGLLFVGLHGLLQILWELQRSKTELRPVRFRNFSVCVLLTIVIPLLSYCVWNLHLSIRFPDGAISKHSVTFTSLLDLLDPQSGAFFILTQFFKRITVFERDLTAVVSIPLAYLSCILCKAIQKKSFARDIRMFCFCLFVYASYLIGMLGMYLFAMPYEEASELASFGRYVLTITSYLTGITFLYLLNECSFPIQKGYAIPFISAVFACILVFLTPVSPSTLFCDNSYDPVKQRLIQAKNEYEIPDESVCYVIGEGNYSLLYFLAQYELWSANVTFGDGPSADEYEQFIQEQEFFIVLEETEASNAFLDTYGLPSGQLAYNLYPLK